MRRANLLLLVVSLALPPTLRPARALAQDAPEETDAAQEAASEAFPWSVSLRLGLGGFSYERDPAFPELEGSFVGAGGVTVRPRSNALIGFDVEVLSVERSFFREFGTPLLGWVDDETSLETLLISTGVRVHLPPSEPVWLYLSGGLGYLEHRMRTGGFFLVFPGTFGDVTSRDLVPYLGFGLEARSGRWGFSADARRFASRASFGDPYFLDDVELGGWSVAAGGSWSFP